MKTSCEVSEEASDKGETERRPKNVSSKLWEKFKALEKRTNEVTQRSTEKRIKHLQKQLLDTVAAEFKSPEDKAELEKYHVDLTQSQSGFAARKRKAGDDGGSEVQACTSQSRDSEGLGKVTKWLDVNSHLHSTDHSRPPPPTALEKSINEAIEKGDFETAESLSDKLATREMGERLVSAFDAKRFHEEKEKQEKSTEAKKKKKLNWGFEAKHRWETKGNM